MQKDKGTDKRMTLTITEVKARQPVGDKGAVKLNFKAKGEQDEQEFWYFTFSQRLFETIEQGKGKELECDINISTREWDGNTYTDRKVFQIYKDGQPIGGRRFGGYQESLGKLHSIESQKRADIIKDLWIAGKLEDHEEDDDLITKLLNWLMKLGEETPNAPQTAPEPSEQPETEPQDLSTLSPSNLGEFFTFALKYKNMNQTQVLEKLELESKEQIADVKESWTKLVNAPVTPLDDARGLL